jgi:hypothetical protein
VLKSSLGLDLPYMMMCFAAEIEVGRRIMVCLLLGMRVMHCCRLALGLPHAAIPLALELSLPYPCLLVAQMGLGCLARLVPAQESREGELSYAYCHEYEPDEYEQGHCLSRPCLYELAESGNNASHDDIRPRGYF